MPWIVNCRETFERTGGLAPAVNRMAFDVGEDWRDSPSLSYAGEIARTYGVRSSEGYCLRDLQILCEAMNRYFPDPMEAKKMFKDPGFKKWASQFLRW